MKTPAQAQILRIHLGDDLSHGAMPLYEYLLYEARARRMAGATILKGPVGYGAAELLGNRAYRVSDAAVLVIEVIDLGNRIADFAEFAKKALGSHGLITLQDTTIIHYNKSDTSSGT